MTVTLSNQMSCGLYIPSLASGSIAGKIIGIEVEKLPYKYPKMWMSSGDGVTGERCIASGLYAFTTGTAAVGDATRMTVSLAMVMFDVSGGERYVVPLMEASMASKWVSEGLGRRNIYKARITPNRGQFPNSVDEFQDTSLAADVMQPKRNGTLSVITQNSMTVDDIEKLLKKTEYKRYPVVVSRESQDLVGVVLRSDLQMVIANARGIIDGITGQSVVVFAGSPPQGELCLPHLPLDHILDVEPVTITDRTPMKTVGEMFLKPGLKQMLVTDNGRLLGVITKKDVLKHVEQFGNEYSNSMLFN